MSSSKAKERVYLREEETSYLQTIIQEWHGKADKKARDAFVSESVLPQMQQLNLQEYRPDIISKNKVARVKWEARVSAVHNWLKNHRPYKERQVFKLERKIPLRRVVGKLKAEEIETLISAKHPGLHKGDKTYPGLYQQAVSEVMGQMSEEEHKEMEEKLEEWQAEGPPLDLRIKAGKKYGRKAIVNAHQLLDKEMYTSCITISMALEPDSGAMAVTCHDYISQIHEAAHGQRFQSFRDWAGGKYSTFMELLIGYANYAKDQRSEESEQEESVAAPIVFQAGPGGLPLLPLPVNGVRSVEIAKQAKEVVRAYFLRHYKLATGCESARTPWATISDDPSKFFNIACLPDGLKFQDPSRMGASVKNLLTHLCQRQEQLGVQAFSFHYILRNNALEPAKYPEGASAALTTEPMDGPPTGKLKAEPDTTATSFPKGEGPSKDSSSEMYDPVLMALSQSNSPDQSKQSASFTSGLQVAGPFTPPVSTGASPNIIPNHAALLNDPRYAMLLHQLYSHPLQLPWGPPGFPAPHQPFMFPDQSNGLPAPPAVMFPGLPMPAGPVHVPASYKDPHPIPPGEPPFAQLYHQFPVAPAPITEPVQKKTPGKTPGKTPRKSPEKMKKEEVEVTPSKKPTRVSNRQRTPKKHFEMNY